MCNGGLLRPFTSGALSMFAPGPTARPALALFKFFLRSADASLSGLVLFGVLHPTDELVARQRRDVLPGVERSNVGRESSTQVGGKLVNYSAGHPLAPHEATVARPSNATPGEKTAQSQLKDELGASASAITESRSQFRRYRLDVEKTKGERKMRRSFIRD